MASRPIACSLLFLCLCSCAAGIPISVSPSSSVDTVPVTRLSSTPSTATVTPTLTITPEPTSTPLDRPLYQIHAAFDTRASDANGWMMVLTVQEQVTYTNRSADSISELVLQFEPSRRKDLFELQSLSSDRASQSAPPIDNGQLRIPLDAPLAPGESVTLRLEYRRNVAQENELIGWNDYQIVLGNWYAFFPPYREGKGWLAHAPGKVGEYLNFPYADFDIQFDLVSDTTYWIAASGNSEAGESPLHFRFTGRSFAIALTTQIPHVQMAGNVEVIGYTRPQYEVQGNFMTDIAAKSLQLFTERYGEYPHPRLTLLESELPDGQEFDGLVFLNPDLFPYYVATGADYLTTITAHETAHQWWYGRVGNDQAIDPWLDEAFATYSELFFYERNYPGLVKWWWWTRVDRYASNQCVDLPVYQFTGFRDYVDSVYLRGARMLHALRLRMGNQGFEEALRGLQTEEFGAVITASDVFRIFQANSSVPLYGIWDQFLCMPPSHG